MEKAAKYEKRRWPWSKKTAEGLTGFKKGLHSAHITEAGVHAHLGNAFIIGKGRLLNAKNHDKEARSWEDKAHSRGLLQRRPDEDELVIEAKKNRDKSRENAANDRSEARRIVQESLDSANVHRGILSYQSKDARDAAQRIVDEAAERDRL